MIDWRFVFFNALWIVGCSVLLAHFSYSRWAKRTVTADEWRTGAQTRFIIQSIAYVITGAGLALVNEGIWIRLAWIALTIAMIVTNYFELKSADQQS